MRKLARYFLVWIRRVFSPDGHGNSPGGYKCSINYRTWDTYIFCLHRRSSVVSTFISLFSKFILFQHLTDGQFRAVDTEYYHFSIPHFFQKPSFILFSGWISNRIWRIAKIVVRVKSSFKCFKDALLDF